MEGLIMRYFQTPGGKMIALDLRLVSSVMKLGDNLVEIIAGSCAPVLLQESFDNVIKKVELAKYKA
jgi:hypothetical protein